MTVEKHGQVLVPQEEYNDTENDDNISGMEENENEQ
jgi:hypothetical protein